MTEPVPTIYGEDHPALTVPRSPTQLDSLLADFTAAQHAHESVEIDTPGNPGVTVRYGTDIPYEMFAAWRKAAIDPEIGLNELTFCTSVLTYACQAIRVGGEDVTDSGVPVNFTSPSLQVTLGVTRPVDAARKFYGRDGYVIAVANRVMVEAGYGAQATPTSR